MNSEQNKIVGSGSASPIGPTRSEQDGPVTMSPATANGVVIHEVSSWEGVSVCDPTGLADPLPKILFCSLFIGLSFQS